GRMNINFNPFELDFIVIADSYGNEIIRFLVPKTSDLKPEDFKFLDDFPEVKEFLKILGKRSILEISEILNNADTAMRIMEYVCTFNKLNENRIEPIIVMMDGLLRTKAIKHELIENLINFLKQNKKRKLVGVAKRSKILNLISSALFLEKKIPLDQTGYIEVPLDLELKAYKWSGRGLIKKETNDRIYYAFGKLYIVKLSKKRDLLLTIEIPYDYTANEPVYSQREVNEIIGHLIKDSMVSYPVIGYPQTIMRAHEKAVRYGFTASIWKDKIIEEIFNKLEDKNLSRLIKDYNFLREYVDKGILGGF
ncbi:MAG: DNA double-strand break repair nuclease NurA, partial [Candidatus Helarchaeota archaeon]